MRRALACHQAKLAEEVTRLHPPRMDYLAAGMLQQGIGGPVEDQVQGLGRLALLDHARARGKPRHSHVVAGQPHGGRLAGEQRDGLQGGAIGGSLPESAIQCASSSAMEVRRGGKTAWYSRCARLWSRASARKASVVSSEIATWSGWP